MRMIAADTSYVGTSFKVTLSWALDMKRFDYVVFLIRKWRVIK